MVIMSGLNLNSFGIFFSSIFVVGAFGKDAFCFPNAFNEFVRMFLIRERKFIFGKEKSTQHLLAMLKIIGNYANCGP